jgi:XTP/dITP diphosphohydrolase
MKLVFATHNANKLKEVQQLMPPNIELLSLDDIGCTEEIPETASTLQGNALIKARYVHQNYNYNCFADDTGLEVDSLGGAPGVYSARYAGPAQVAEDNIDKLLGELKGVDNRRAQFRTVIALITGGEELLFEGICQGEITLDTSGTEGFGYDPVFRPRGYKRTFAQMSMEEKGEISHRGRALKKLQEYLFGKNN